MELLTNLVIKLVKNPSRKIKCDLVTEKKNIIYVKYVKSIVSRDHFATAVSIIDISIRPYGYVSPYL